VTTEDDFRRIYNRNPADRHTVLVLADWFQDRDDPRAGGLRAAAALGRYPHRAEAGFEDWSWYRRSGYVGDEDYEHAILPDDWFGLLAGGQARVHGRQYVPSSAARAGLWLDYPCPYDAVTAAARAFVLLPAERQAELLTPAAHPSGDPP
jgi:uncharacterized protein (TIGR02996 family)